MSGENNQLNGRPPTNSTGKGDPTTMTSPTVSTFSAEDDAIIASLDSMTAAELKNRLRAIDNEVQVLKANLRRSREELKRIKMDHAQSGTAITRNKRLPYLVANVGEILEMDSSYNDEELDVGNPKKSKTYVAAVVKTSNRQVIFLPMVGLVDPKDLKPDDLVGVHKDSYIIYEKLPEDYDSRVKAMEIDERPKEKYSDVGGLDKQINEMLEAVVLPITNKAQYEEIGIKPPKGVLLYGVPGTGKTLLARACAAAVQACFLKLAGPQLVQMYIGDGARIVRDAFALAKKKAPSIIFLDELDAVGARRSDSSEHGSREVQRTMLELLSQLDGFGSNDGVRVIAATNRVDVLDPALLRSGRIDRKVEFPMPDEDARARILKIHSRKMTLDKGVNFEELQRSTDDMNGAQLKAVCVEAGMLALRHDRTSVSHEDFIDGIAAVQAKKKMALNYFA